MNASGNERLDGTEDAALTRALLYLRACGMDDSQRQAMSRQLQAVADPDASQLVRTRLLMDRAMALGRQLIEQLPLPPALPQGTHVRQLVRQELGKPVTALRPGWWWAPWRKAKRSIRDMRGGRDE